MTKLTLAECTASPCFFCKSMSTELGELDVESSVPKNLLAHCTKHQASFNKERCEHYDESKAASYFGV